VAEPRFASKRVPSRATFGGEVGEMAVRLGTPLMPWQREVADVCLEFRANGRAFRHDVVVTVPRQQGKSVLAAAVAAWWAEKWPDQHIMFLAQTRTAAAARLSGVARRLAGDEGVQWYRGVGNEHVKFGNGSRISVESPNIHGAHGESYDLLILDEAWSYEEHVLQGVLPTQSAKPNSQLWMISTMGTEDSEVWNRYVERGREAVKERDESVGFFEWAADLDAGDDVFDPEQWGRWMPALGYTIEAANILPAIAAMSPGEAMRAFGNVLTATDSELFPVEWWPRALNAYEVRPENGISFAFDLNLDPAGSSIVAAWPTETGWHVELVERQGGEGSAWLLPKVLGLIRDWRPVSVSTIGGAPVREISGQVKAFCESRGVPFRQLSMQDFAAASQGLYEALRVEELTHGDSESLAVAVGRVRVKEAGDLWRFDRRASRVDVSPLVAAAVALYAGKEAAASKRDAAIWFPSGGR